MLPLFISNIEYVTLRLLRRFVFPKDMHRWGRYVPFYRTNLGESQPDQVCRPYIDWLAAERRSVVGKRVIEVGSGATNAVGYALICAGARGRGRGEVHVKPRMLVQPRLHGGVLVGGVVVGDQVQRLAQHHADGGGCVGGVA